MLNLKETILSNPNYFRQLRCRDFLVTLYNCPLEKKYEDVWSEQNYIIYVMEGRKIWHTAHGSYDLQKGSCVFVRKGACIVEQFFDSAFCLVMFFLPDDFIREVLQSRKAPIASWKKKYEPIISIDQDDKISAFFKSMMPHFDSQREPDASLLEIKFRELILTLADNPKNHELLTYFEFLLQQPHSAAIKTIMEENFRYNLKLEQFALLCNRSLSAFKRDFQKLFETTPGKWLMEKRLQHAKHLMSHFGKTVAEAAFESGFENPSHFSRCFRQRFGSSPVSFRQQFSA